MANNKLTKCKACGAEIAKAAKTCPQCGAKIKNKKVLLIGILVLVIVIAIAAGSGDSEPKKVGEIGSTQTETQDSGNKKSTFAVGEIAEMKNVRAALVSVEESTGSTYNKPADGKVFLICEFEIENLSKEEMNVSSILCFEAYCDDYSCSTSFGGLLEKEDKEQLDGTVAPGKKMNGVIAYEVPEDWQKLEIHFTPDAFTNDAFVFVATNS